MSIFRVKISKLRKAMLDFLFEHRTDKLEVDLGDLVRLVSLGSPLKLPVTSLQAPYVFVGQVTSVEAVPKMGGIALVKLSVPIFCGARVADPERMHESEEQAETLSDNIAALCREFPEWGTQSGDDVWINTSEPTEQSFGDLSEGEQVFMASADLTIQVTVGVD